MQITWNIGQLNRNTADGLVTTAHWTVSAQDGEYSASTGSGAGLDVRARFILL